MKKGGKKLYFFCSNILSLRGIMKDISSECIIKFHLLYDVGKLPASDTFASRILRGVLNRLQLN